MAVGFSSCSMINNVTMTPLLFGLDFTYYLSSFCLMCTLREIWIPPIILPISLSLCQSGHAQKLEMLTILLYESLVAEA